MNPYLDTNKIYLIGSYLYVPVQFISKLQLWLDLVIDP